MPTDTEAPEHPYLDTDREGLDADEFLKRRLDYLTTNFSYENLSGLSPDGLDRRQKLIRTMFDDLRCEFMNPDFAYADEPQIANAMIGDGKYLYPPLTEDQRWAIINAEAEIDRNLDKAYEDAKDRKFDRLAKATSSIPLLSRLK